MNRKTATLATVLALGASLSITGPASAGASLGMKRDARQQVDTVRELKRDAVGTVLGDTRGTQATIFEGAIRWSNLPTGPKTWWANGDRFTVYSLHPYGDKNRLVFQRDGNLVAYNSAGRAIWNTRTVGADRIVAQGDTNLVIYKGSKAVWWTGKLSWVTDDGLRSVGFGWPQSGRQDQLELRSWGKVDRVWRMAS